MIIQKKIQLLELVREGGGEGKREKEREGGSLICFTDFPLTTIIFTSFLVSRIARSS